MCLKLLCAIIFPPLVPFIVRRFSWTFLFLMILACCSGWVPGIVVGIFAVLQDQDDGDDENSAEESTESQSSPQQSTSDAVQNNVEERLSKLKQMLEQGIITEEEYTKQRSKIIGDI